MDATPAASTAPSYKYFRSPKNLVRRFVAKRSSRSALVWGVILGLYIISKASGFIQTYPTVAAREKLAVTLGANVGIKALLGSAHHIETIAGYAVWNFLCLIAAVGAVWALLLAVKTFRGEEDSGRWELFLAGQTTARQAATNALIGLMSGLVVLYVCFALAILAVGRLHGANFTTSASLFFSLTLIAGAAEFLAVGALASQLMPVRSRATGLATAVFGVFYIIRLIADTTSASWLLNISPLGWIEKLQPMNGSDAIWLVPIAGFVLLCSWLAIVLAGRRDLGSATFADKDSAKSHTLFLKTPLRAAIRLNRTATFVWLFSIGLMSLVYGSLSKAAVQSFQQSNSAEKFLNRLAQTSKTNLVVEFMGIVFFMVMIVAMFYVGSAIGRMREDEAQGYLDNFLVRPVSRLRWLGGRVALILVVILLAGLLSCLGTWAGEAAQHAGVSFHTLLLASINAITPLILVLGIGVFAMGSWPRFTNLLTYGAIAWSFLMVMLGSGLNLNHWLLDTSILHHVSFAPAVSANWHTDTILVALGLALCLVGAWRFNARDIQGE